MTASALNQGGVMRLGTAVQPESPLGPVVCAASVDGVAAAGASPSAGVDASAVSNSIWPRPEVAAPKLGASEAARGSKSSSSLWIASSVASFGTMRTMPSVSWASARCGVAPAEPSAKAVPSTATAIERTRRTRAIESKGPSSEKHGSSPRNRARPGAETDTKGVGPARRAPAAQP